MLCPLFFRFPSPEPVITQMFLPWSVNDFCSYNNPFTGHPLLAWHWVFRMKRTKRIRYSSCASKFVTNMVLSSPDFPSVPIQWQEQGTYDKEPQKSFPLCELCCVFVIRGLHCWHFAQRWLQLDRQRKSHSNDRQLIKPVTKTICWPPIWIANESVTPMRYGEKKASMGLSGENWLLQVGNA